MGYTLEQFAARCHDALKSQPGTEGRRAVRGLVADVLNDNDLGMVSQGMAFFYPQTPGHFKDLYRLGNPDLKKYAEALGADAWDVHSPAEMRDALRNAFVQATEQRRPQVIVAHIDPVPLPPYYTRKNVPELL